MLYKKLPHNEFIKKMLGAKTEIVVIGCGKVLCRENWHIPERTISDHLIYFIQSGTVIGTIGGNTDAETVSISAGDVFWIMPGVLHRFNINTVTNGSNKKNEPAAVVCYYRFYAASGSIPLRIKDDTLYLKQFISIFPVVSQFIQSKSGLHQCDADIQRLFICALCGMIIVQLNGKEDYTGAHDGLSPLQRERALEYISKNINARIPMRRLSDYCGLNSEYFTKQFKKTFSKPPALYITHMRIKLAAEALAENGKRIKEAARMFGFSDEYFFSKQFKRVLGVSPRKWMNGQRQMV